MTFDRLVRGGTVVTAAGSRQADVAIRDGRIVDVAPGIPAEPPSRSSTRPACSCCPASSTSTPTPGSASDDEPDRFFQDSVAAAFGGHDDVPRVQQPRHGHQRRRPADAARRDRRVARRRPRARAPSTSGCPRSSPPSRSDPRRTSPRPSTRASRRSSASWSTTSAWTRRGCAALLPRVRSRPAACSRSTARTGPCSTRASPASSRRAGRARGTTPTRGRRPCEATGTRPARSRSPPRSVRPSTSSTSRRRRPWTRSRRPARRGQRVHGRDLPALPGARRVALRRCPTRPRIARGHLAAAPLASRPGRAVGSARDGALDLVATDHVPDRLAGREALDRASRSPRSRTARRASRRCCRSSTARRGARPDDGRADGRPALDHAGAPVRVGRQGSGRGRAGRRPRAARPGRARVVRASDLHHTSDFTPYEGMEVPGRVRRVMVRGRTSSWTACSSGAAATADTWRARCRPRARPPARRQRRPRTSAEPRVRPQRQEVGELV